MLQIARHIFLVLSSSFSCTVFRCNVVFPHYRIVIVLYCRLSFRLFYVHLFLIFYLSICVFCRFLSLFDNCFATLDSLSLFAWENFGWYIYLQIRNLSIWIICIRGVQRIWIFWTDQRPWFLFVQLARNRIRVKDELTRSIIPLKSRSYFYMY